MNALTYLNNISDPTEISKSLIHKQIAPNFNIGL